VRATSVPTPRNYGPLAYLWAYFPAMTAVGCLGVFVWMLVARPIIPVGGLLLEVAAVVAFIVGTNAFASIMAGAALLEEQSDNEPLRFKEAGWILGVPIGIALTLALVLARDPLLPDTVFAVVLRPLLICLAFAATLWAMLTRILLRVAGLTLQDYACAVFMPRDRYMPLARRKHAWAAARQPAKLTLEEARGYLPDIVPALAHRLAAARDEARGDVVARMLGDLGAESVAPELIATLESKRPNNRRVAAITLGKLGVLEALPALSEHALKDPEVHVRRAAVVALGRLDSSAAIPTLLEVLSDRQSGVRQSACVALGNLRATEALPALEHCAQTEKSQVRTSAERAIARITGADAEVTPDRE
jgi:hypothetical protein